MQIECRFNCEAGRVIEFDGPAGPRSIAYKFGPGRGPWVVEVTDPEHLGAMLASPQKFRVVVEAGRGRALPKPTAAPDPGETDPAALGPTPAETALAEALATIAEMRAQMDAMVASGTTPVPPEAVRDSDGGTAEGEPVSSIQPNYDDMTLEEAQAAFERKFHRKPHPMAKLPKLIAHLKGTAAAGEAPTTE